MSAIPGQPAVWDDRRNTSQTRQPDPLAVKAALAACRKFREEHPRHAAWVAAGAPPIRSDDDHARWFGESYETSQKRRRR